MPPFAPAPPTASQNVGTAQSLVGYPGPGQRVRKWRLMVTEPGSPKLSQPELIAAPELLASACWAVNV